MKFSLIDLANILISRGGSFLLTLSIFFIIGRGMPPKEFAEFGYWWSISLMIGGLLLGGQSLAISRSFVLHGSLQHLVRPFVKFLIVLLSAATLTLLLSTYVFEIDVERVFFWGVLFAFGFILQIQVTLFAIFRVAEMFQVNFWATVLNLVLILVAVAIFAEMGRLEGIINVYKSLVISFIVGLFGMFYIGRGEIKKVFKKGESRNQSLVGFFSGSLVFMVINAFNYVVVNADFTISRNFMNSNDFFVAATAKIYFERFVLPLLLVVAGVFSMRVLRERDIDNLYRYKYKNYLSYKKIAIFVFGILFICGGYIVFVELFRRDAVALNVTMVFCLAVGYMLMAINGVMLDAFAMKYNFGTVFVATFSMVFLYCVIQILAINMHGLLGWSVGCLLFNMFVHATLFYMLRT